MSIDIDQMSVLDRRRIEAMVLGPMIRAFEQEIGKDRAHAVARRVIIKIAQDQGKALSQRLGGNDLSTFSKGKDPWTRGGALEMDVLEDSEVRVSFNVTRCRYAEMYRELGMEDLGFIFSCGRDGALSGGFNLALGWRGLRPSWRAPATATSDTHRPRNPRKTVNRQEENSRCRLAK